MGQGACDPSSVFVPSKKAERAVGRSAGASQLDLFERGFVNLLCGLMVYRFWSMRGRGSVALMTFAVASGCFFLRLSLPKAYVCKIL